MVIVLLLFALQAPPDLLRAYAEGLDAARAAVTAGGSPESLEAVARQIAVVEMYRGDARAPIAAAVLRAAAAASQSERDEMALHIDHAMRLELLQIEAGQPLLPVTAHEAAGDLWLQVHRYDEARAAYQRAAARIGMTPRIREALARVCARIACTP